jgi:hypothetical protein
MDDEILVSSASEFAEDLNHFVCERAGGNYSILRALQLRRRDHFHGLSDLLCILDRFESASDI